MKPWNCSSVEAMPARSGAEIAFAGCGPAAPLLARRLAEAFGRTLVFAPGRNHFTITAASDARFAACGSLAELCARASVAVTILPDERALRELLFDDAGLVRAAGDVPAVLDLSPLEPWALQEIAAAWRRAGGFLAGGRVVTASWKRDAPVTLYLDDDAAQRGELQRVARALADEVVQTRGTGSAKTVGLLADLLLGVNTVVAFEALGLGEAAGLDTDTLIGLLMKGSGALRVLETIRHRDGDFIADDDSPALGSNLECAASAARRVDHCLFFGSMAMASSPKQHPSRRSTSNATARQPAA